MARSDSSRMFDLVPFAPATPPGRSASRALARPASPASAPAAALPWGCEPPAAPAPDRQR